MVREHRKRKNRPFAGKDQAFSNSLSERSGPMSIITVQNLCKTYDVREKAAPTGFLSRWFGASHIRKVDAVQGVSFTLDRGEQVAFIGPNGAGKSTTLKILTGILFPTSGDVSVLGLTPWQQRAELAKQIGIVFGQRSQLWSDLPFRDSLQLLTKIYGLPAPRAKARQAAVIDMLALDDLLSRTPRQMSLGQRMRCEIAASLLHEPKILFLDEPTIGLDVTAKASLRDHLNRIVRDDGVTLLLTSHDTGDIEELCRRVIVINHGQIMLDDSLEKLRRDYLQTKYVTLTTEDLAPTLELDGVTITGQDAHQISLAVDTTRLPIADLVPDLFRRFQVKDVMIADPPLEETIQRIYARQTGGPA
jgi:ABC-2 type transport system ATP-binding protein